MAHSGWIPISYIQICYNITCFNAVQFFTHVGKKKTQQKSIVRISSQFCSQSLVQNNIFQKHYIITIWFHWKNLNPFRCLYPFYSPNHVSFTHKLFTQKQLINYHKHIHTPGHRIQHICRRNIVRLIAYPHHNFIYNLNSLFQKNAVKLQLCTKEI